jgi:hypothetical protein
MVYIPEKYNNYRLFHIGDDFNASELYFCNHELKELIADKMYVPHFIHNVENFRLNKKSFNDGRKLDVFKVIHDSDYASFFMIRENRHLRDDASWVKVCHMKAYPLLTPEFSYLKDNFHDIYAGEKFGNVVDAIIGIKGKIYFPLDRLEGYE